MAKGATDFAIVADIGGTNARFSRVRLTDLSLDKVQVYPCAQFASLSDALQHYRQQEQLFDLLDVAIAIACPVQGDVVQMTNFHWTFSIQQMRSDLQLNTLLVMNDFTAVAMCLPALKETDRIQCGQGDVQLNHPMAVLGAGTGLGVGHLVPLGSQQYLPLPGEGGHVDWAATTEQEWFIQQFLAERYGHVSPERLLSGPGLEDLYQAIAAYQHKTVEPLSAADISRHALAGSNELAEQTVAQFFASLGSVAGNLALTLSTLGGVYIGGGIVPKLLPLLGSSDFRQRFEQKGRFAGFNERIATFVITADQPGLTGAGMYLKQTIISQPQGE
ncbi:glucokinase [Alkalimonas collagenimarina]|uniref:Glucokinase n=1 Tax=Alkalimonas collagenimarina TaxID=400390 RepID=A0ABT9H2U1_9GAMM|nr:glucokinase [Alkalimonas collagenimarina]MDP4537630.1 glucokinase [Alkalimonas collagenimarina]